MIEQYTVRQEGAFPVVRPPPGSDVYMEARVYMWWPMLELEKGQTYRLHLSSIDLQHGFSLQPVNINIQVHPGYEMVVSMTPNQTGQYGIVCNEFCGFGHHTMTGRIYVVDKN
jgi:cytochrome c oxidase subunit II